MAGSIAAATCYTALQCAVLNYIALYFLNVYSI